MCGCGGTGSLYKSSSSFCGTKSNRLATSREKLAILYNLTKDPELKSKYKADRLFVQDLLKEMYETGSCPDLATIVEIENEVNNEYSKYHNS